MPALDTGAGSHKQGRGKLVDHLASDSRFKEPGGGKDQGLRAIQSTSPEASAPSCQEMEPSIFQAEGQWTIWEK